MLTAGEVKQSVIEGAKKKFRLPDLSDEEWEKVYRAVAVLECIERGYKYEDICCEIFGMLLGEGRPVAIREIVRRLSNRHPVGSIYVALHTLRKHGLIEGGQAHGYIWFTKGVAEFIGVPYINPVEYKQRLKPSTGRQRVRQFAEL